MVARSRFTATHRIFSLRKRAFIRHCITVRLLQKRNDEVLVKARVSSINIAFVNRVQIIKAKEGDADNSSRNSLE